MIGIVAYVALAAPVPDAQGAAKRWEQIVAGPTPVAGVKVTLEVPKKLADAGAAPTKRIAQGTRKLIARPFMVRLPNGETEKVVLPAGFQTGDAAQVCFLGKDLKQKVACSALEDQAKRQGTRVVEVRSSTFAKRDARLPSKSMKLGAMKKRTAAAAAAGGRGAPARPAKILPFGKVGGSGTMGRGAPRFAPKKALRQATRKEAKASREPLAARRPLLARNGMTSNAEAASERASSANQPRRYARAIGRRRYSNLSGSPGFGIISTNCTPMSHAKTRSITRPKMKSGTLGSRKATSYLPCTASRPRQHAAAGSHGEGGVPRDVRTV